MILEIKNCEELNNWFKNRMRMNHDFHAIKGVAPTGATYEDGDLIYNEINVAWRDSVTHEVIKVEYHLEQ